MDLNLKKIHKTFCLQKSQNSCGLACLVSIARLYGKNINEEQLIINSGITTQGTSVLGLRDAARKIGFIADGFEADIDSLKQIENPAILHIINEDGFNHFVVCYGYDFKQKSFVIGNPAKGILFYSRKDLSYLWKSKILLSLKPSPDFIKIKDTRIEKKKFFNRLISPDMHFLLATFLLSMSTSLLGFSTAIFSQKLIDEVIPSKKVDTLLYYISLYLFLIIISIILSYSRNILIVRQTKVFNSRLIQLFLSKIFSMPKSFFSSMQVGEIISRMKETERIQGAIVALINSTLVEFFTLFFAIIILMYYNIEIAIIAAFSIPIMIGVTQFFSIRIKKIQKEVMINYANFEAHSIESISGMLCIKTCVQEIAFNKRLQFQYDSTQEAVKKLGHISLSYDLIINILGSVFSVLSMLLGSYYVMIAKLEIGQLFAIITILSLTITTSINIISAIVHIQEAIVVFERFHDIVTAEDESSTVPSGNHNIIHDITQKHCIEINNLSFNYPGKSSLLDNINIKVSTGEFITLFGDIGTGKSTLIYLLQKFYPIKTGEILFDGKNINNFAIQDWRSQLGIVSQNTKIFMGTVVDNITMFRENYIHKAEFLCRKLGLNYFLTPNSTLYFYNVLNENGVNLSGGQRQLIGLVRALLDDTNIIILDEPTAAMDKATELQIIDILKDIKSHKIIIMTTHKPEIAKRTDKIYLLTDYKILNEGTHEELIRYNNLYHRYYNTLFK